MAGQVARISPARQIVVAQPVTHTPTMIPIGLLDGCAQPECHTRVHCLVREEKAKLLCVEGGEPGPAACRTGSKEVCLVDLVGFTEEVVQAVS